MNSSMEKLSRADLGALKPVRGEGGKSIRAFCPFHGGDRQRSLRVDELSGRFHCFACGAWGYLEESRAEFLRDRPSLPRPAVVAAPPPPKFENREPLLRTYQVELRRAKAYLEGTRGIPLELATRYGLGFSASGRWAHRSRDCESGRVVFPHTTPAGAVVNLYGRAASADALRELRHDHLPGPKGYFNASALCALEGPLFVCEGPFDALSLIAAGVSQRVVAIFGLRGWRWEWARGVREMVLALDADAAGSAAWRELGREARLRGIRVTVMEDYGGFKDANEAWTAGQLNSQPSTVISAGCGAGQLAV
jgi:DNA primase